MERPMSLFEKHFTLEEATGLVPHVRTVFAKVHQLMQEPNPASSGLMPSRLPINGNGHSLSKGLEFKNDDAMGPILAGLKDSDRVKLIRELLEDLNGRGIVIQDIQRGLIDFPGYRQDNEILLCYELCDGSEIVAWHGIHDGYAGREPLDSYIR